MPIITQSFQRVRTNTKVFHDDAATVEAQYNDYENTLSQETDKTWTVRVIAGGYYDGKVFLLAEASYPERNEDQTQYLPEPL